MNHIARNYYFLYFARTRRPQPEWADPFPHPLLLPVALLSKYPACSGLKGALSLSDMRASGKKLEDKIPDIELLGQRLCTLELLETGKIPFKVPSDWNI